MVLIAVSGKARAGKTTFSTYLAEGLKEVMDKDFILMNYADELKIRLRNDFDLTHDQLYGEKKEEPDYRYRKEVKYASIASPFDNYEDGKLWEDKDLYWSARELMQFIGTDCYRKVDYDFWVKSLFKRIEQENINNVIVADCRFKNEIDAIVDRGGYHVRILRPNFGGIDGKTHESEIELEDDYKIDFKINNIGTLTDLNTLAFDTAKIIKHLIENTTYIGEKNEYNS
jgi:hypothetical protein